MSPWTEVLTVQWLTNKAIECTSVVLLFLLCGEVIFRTAVMTWRAVKSSWGERDK